MFHCSESVGYLLDIRINRSARLVCFGWGEQPEIPSVDREECVLLIWMVRENARIPTGRHQPFDSLSAKVQRVVCKSDPLARKMPVTEPLIFLVVGALF